MTWRIPDRFFRSRIVSYSDRVCDVGCRHGMISVPTDRFRRLVTARRAADVNQRVLAVNATLSPKRQRGAPVIRASGSQDAWYPALALGAQRCNGARTSRLTPAVRPETDRYHRLVTA